MTNKTKAFTLIELLAVIVILAIIALITTPIIIGLIDDARRESFKSSSYGITKSAESGFAITLLNQEEATLTEYSYNNGVETRIQGNIEIKYNGRKPNSGTLIVNGIGQTTIAFYQDGYCATKSYNKSEITLEKVDIEECVVPADIPGIIVNSPLLATGMTAIKWNGNNWIDTTSTDEEWYDYTIKKWANARTADGSFWVWIPRYIYKTSDGWHSNTTGIIDVQFSMGIEDNWNNSVIGNINTNANANSSNNKWTNHPAFTFAGTELTGIWVAKFEATALEGVANGYYADGTCPTIGDNVTTKKVKIIPNTVSWRCITNNNAFIVARNMETDSNYGWGTTGNGIDTHLMKNIEWGAAAYLSKSIYGKYTEEIWINNNREYITGCAGSSVSAPINTECENPYETLNGGKSSTTGTIYGVYDMVGGSWERMAAYLDNGNPNLNDYGTSIISADEKYVDKYEMGENDSETNNYALTSNKKGDAIYETSSNGENGNNSWFNDKSRIPTSYNPWFLYGGGNNHTTNAGIFGFSTGNGTASGFYGFRPVLLVSPGL